MTFTIITGAQAVGKMTVGQELERLSGHKLFHNHMTIDMVLPFFKYGKPKGRALVNTLRNAFFDAFAEDADGGYIFTFVWAFSEPEEAEYINGIADKFAAKGHDVHWVELIADQDERLRRNRTDNRLAHKPSKRDIDWSERDIINTGEKYRLVSNPGEITAPSYLRLETTDMPADQAAARIWDHIRGG